MNQLCGKKGELRALSYLKDCGYTILECNWRYGHKEVDIICTDGELLIVVEVKTRNNAVETPEELLSYRKRRNLLQAGEAYLARHKMEKEIRFDLIIVAGEEQEIHHIREAIRTIDM